MRRLALQYLLTILAIAGGVIGAIQFKQSNFDNGTPDQKVAMGFLGFIATFFLFESLYYRLRWGRDCRYASALNLINKAFNHIHTLEINNTTQLKDVAQAMQLFCTEIASSFGKITGVECAVCIKGLYIHNDLNNNSAPAVRTLFRDSASHGHRSPKDQCPAVQFIHLNSSYRRILTNLKRANQRFFMSNNLPFFWGYESTSFSYYGEPREINIPLIDHLLRNWRWPLSYKSTLVVPLCGLDTAETDTLVGFLCVDSPYRGAFKKRFDLDLLVGVADGIARKLKQLQDNQDAILAGSKP